MPFPNQTPRPYTRENVEALSKGQMGCYGLFRTGVWIYVGKGDIRERMLAHVGGDNACINREQPTHWVCVATGDYDAMEKQLIVELAPICNQRVG